MKHAMMILGMVFYLGACQIQSKKDIEYQYYTAIQMDLVDMIETNGSIEMENYTDIKAPVGGRLEKLYIEEGQFVSKGQKIGYISSNKRIRLLDMAAHKGPAEIAYWKKQVLPTYVFSPVSGKVVEIRNQPGDQVGHIARVSSGELIRANVDEIDLPKLTKGQKVVVTFDINKENKFECTLSKIAQVSKKVRNVNVYEVEIMLPSKSELGELEPQIGMSVTVEFPINKVVDAIAISSAAVNNQSNKTILVQDRQGQSKYIVVGNYYGDQVHVKEGLAVGDVIRLPKFDHSSDKKKKSLLDLAGKK